MRDRIVAIAGCGAVTAVGHGVAALRSALQSNASGLHPNGRFDHPRFQSKIVGTALQNGDSGLDDPAYRLATEALREARDQARDSLASIPPERIGLVLATTKANLEALERLSDGRPCSEVA